jgi:hypothetical protein
MINGSHQHVTVLEEDPKTFSKYSHYGLLGCQIGRHMNG